jgi:hypothetical protein
MANQAPFPEHNIDPSEKDDQWVMKYCKAAWNEFQSSGIKMFYGSKCHNGDEYSEINDYILGKQSIDKYKKELMVDEAADESWVNIDWTPRPVAAKLRDIGLSKLAQSGYNIVATPIDLLAKDETETYYAEHKARLQVQELMRQSNPELANSPMFAKEKGDPEDLEELDMMMEYGPKLKIAMEAEMGVDLVFYNNNFKNLRAEVDASIFDYGPGGYKEYVDENGDVKIRPVDVSMVIVSHCERRDFSDARYIGEVSKVKVGDLPFDKETRQKILESATANNGVYNSSHRYGMAADSETVQVLDIEFYSYNDRVYERRQQLSGNIVHRRAPYKKKNSNSKTMIDGKEVSRYKNKPIQVIYKGKWIVGTDYIYDAGQATYQKRAKGNKAKTYFSYHLYASNFIKMRCTSMMKRLIPLIDEYHTTIYKMMNFKAKWVPYIINLDIQAMENVALGGGGDPMSPKEILELIFTNFTALGRRMDVSGQLQNYKMVDIEPTGMSQEYNALVADLARVYQQMRDIVGLNELTDGSTPKERTLNGVANLATDATNNALSPVMDADKALTESLAKGVILRLVQTVKERDVSGVVRTLGDETVKFVRATKDICDRIWDIKLEDRPTAAQREMLIQQINIKENQGLITPEDVIMISETNNLKQARTLLAYRIKKRRKEMEEMKLREMQQNGKIQQDSSRVAEEEKRKTLQLEADLKKMLDDNKFKHDKELLEMKLNSQRDQSDVNASTKIITEGMRQEKKEMEPAVN